MKFTEPKTKTGKPLLGVKISYYPENVRTSRWFLNGECAPVEKIAQLLNYKNKDQLMRGIHKHGAAKVISKGLDKIWVPNYGN